MERWEVLMMRKKNKVYLTLNSTERRLLIQGLLSFRNKVIARGIDTVDIDRILKKGYNMKYIPTEADCALFQPGFFILYNRSKTNIR